MDAADYEVDATRASFTQPAQGEVTLVDDATLLTVGPPLYDAVRANLPGAVGRDEYWWVRHVGPLAEQEPGLPPPFNALYRGESGEVEGLLRYRVEAEWRAMRPGYRMQVEDLLTATPAAHLGLWRYACEADLVTLVRANRRPVDEALPYLLGDGRAAHRLERYDFIWARLLDVPAALSARRYGTSGSLVLSLTDPLAIAGGTYRLDTDQDGARCTVSDASPQLSMGIDTLVALYLGGPSVRRLADAGRIEEHAAGSLERAAALFQTTTQPWCPTFF